MNRSLARAEDLVRGAGAGFTLRAAALDEVGSELARADVVLAAVAAEAHVLDDARLRRASPARCW